MNVQKKYRLEGANMFDFITGYLEKTLNVSEELSILTYYLLLTVIVLFMAFISNWIGKKIILKAVSKLVFKTKTTKDESFYSRKVFHMVIHYIPIVVVYLLSGFYMDYADFVRKGLLLFLLVITVIVISRSLDAFNDIYMEHDFAKSMPIKGLLQILKIIVVIFVALIGWVSINDTGNAVAILGSLGGMSAVVLLIFRDSILGFVAGIQLSMNHFLSIGDWIEMPKYHADGEVVDVSLTKISVRNWDKTISHIPAYKFIEESFVNWDGMSKSGGRRIKRDLLIDVNSIGFLTEKEVGELREIHILKDYLDAKINEISVYNEDDLIRHEVSKRRLTNIGTYRAYVEQYLKNHPKVKSQETLLVRQLEAQGSGLPIQVYCFTNDTRWAYYEGIQSDIFDHLYAILPYFGLKAYQAPTGQDLRSLSN